MSGDAGSNFSFDSEDRSLMEFLLGKKNANIDDTDEELCQQYVENLSSFGLSKLSNLPEKLDEKRQNILKQTEQLAYENYKTFIQAAECSKDIYDDFNIIEEHLVETIDLLPKFTKQVDEFSKSSQDINVCRKQNSLILSKHTQLLEILEIPQLMDTCVRNGYYEEALDLTRYINNVQKKFSSIKILADINGKIKACTQLMLNQLLEQLRGDIKLPGCLRVIGYLRQLDVFNDAELRITFLQARGHWLRNLLAQIPHDTDECAYLIKVLEVNRVNLFDVITQYRAIFSDESNSFLHSWLTRKISEFIFTLQKHLRAGVSGRLESLYSHCMYFGLSFNRIGAEFRGLLVPVFQQFALTHFKEAIKTATKRFKDDISVFTTSSDSKKSDVKFLSNDVCSPPHELLDFPPLVIYLNGILAAFNDLRQFPALHFAFVVKKLLQKSLLQSLTSLKEWARLECQSVSNFDDVRTLCHTMVTCFLPFVSQMFEKFFPASSLSNMIGRLPADYTVQLYAFDIQPLIANLEDFVDTNNVNVLEVKHNQPPK